MARAFTLGELLVALALVGMIMAACVSLFTAAGSAFQLAAGRAELLQEGQASLERIRRAVEGAYATAEFPGFFVLEDRAGPWYFPQTLVVWRPEGPVSSDRKRPLVDELVIFCPHPQFRSQLVEIRVPGASTLCPPIDDRQAWQALLASVLTSPSAKQVVLTRRLRVVATGDPLIGDRPAVFFFAMLRPSEEELAQFRAGNRTWKSLPWVHGICGPHYGLRQHWLRIELQLVKAGDSSADSPREVLPLFASTAVYFGMPRSE